MAAYVPAPVELREGDSPAPGTQALRPAVARSLWVAGPPSTWLLAFAGPPVRAGGVNHPPASADLANRPVGRQVCLGLGPDTQRCCCMRLSGGKPEVPGAGLTCLVLCAPGAAASLRGNGRRRLSVTSDRCLLGLAGTTTPAAPALSHWKGLLFRGEEEA